MKNISIFYNPYTESTRLFIDEKELHRNGRRIAEYIVGKPIREWLSPYVKSYLRWNGLLPELMSELNDDEIEITFSSSPAFFSRMQEQLSMQAQLLEGEGYSADQWKCKYVASFLPENVAGHMAAFIAQEKPFVRDQQNLDRFEYCEQMLAESSDNLPEKLREIYEKLCEAVKEAKNYCASSPNDKGFEGIWIKAERELPKIFHFTGQTAPTTSDADTAQETI